MKNIFFIIIWLTFNHLQAQNQSISGQIFDAKTHKPLAFANVYTDKNTGTTADFDGKFKMLIPENIQNINISYIGYASQKIKLNSNKKYYKIYLKPSTEQLNEVVLSTKVENPALKIIRNVVKHKKNNDYSKKLKKFGFTKYYKFLVTVNRKALNCALDSVRNPKKDNAFVRVDSTMFDFCKETKNNDLYLIENITKVNGNNGKIYNKVIASKMAGFKNPIYEFLQLQMSNQNVYNDYYKFLMKSYLSPLSKISAKQYKYKIIDTSKIQGRKVYKISYKNTKKPLIIGDLYIDTKTYAIAKMTLNSYKQIELKTEYDFKYYPQADVWFPVNANTIIKKAEQKDDVNIGNAVSIGFYIKDSLSHSNKQTPGDVMYAEITTKISEILFNKNNDFKSRYNIDIAPNATHQKEEVWRKYRKISARELNTYKYMDSVFKAEKIEEKMMPYRKLFTGYYPFHFFDFNVLHLLDYNQYEGFRLQIGGKTNEKLSNKFYINSYVAYGFRDKALKYGGGFHYKLHHATQTYLDFSYTKDLDKSSSFMDFHTDTQQFTSISHLADANFVNHKKFDFGFRTLLTPKFSININVYQSINDTKFDAPYHRGRIEFKNYDVIGLKTKLIWEPRSKYMLTDFGRRRIENAYPKFLLGFETNFPSFQTDKSKFMKFETQSIFRKTYINKDFTDLAVNLGMSLYNPNINQLYQPDFNSVGDPIYRKNFNISGLYKFESVKDFEFLNNFLITAHLSHRINHIKLGKKHHFDMRFTTAVAYGLAFDSNKYTGVTDLRKGLYESGIEFYKLLKNMGVGVYYRYGAYASPESIKNLSVRLTLSSFNFFK